MDPSCRSAGVRGRLSAAEMTPMHVIQGSLGEADPRGWAVRRELQRLGLETEPVRPEVRPKELDDRRTLGPWLGAKPAQHVHEGTHITRFAAGRVHRKPAVTPNMPETAGLQVRGSPFAGDGRTVGTGPGEGPDPTEST